MAEQDNLDWNDNDIRSIADERALHEVSQMFLEKEVNFPQNINNLGLGAADMYSRLLRRTSEEVGGHLSYAIGVAIREFWYACFRASIYMELSFSSQTLPRTDLQKKLVTPEGYADYEGWAPTLSDGLADLPPRKQRFEFLRDTPFSELIAADSLLQCMSLHWFAFADELMGEHKVNDALELLHEAYDALALAHGLSMHKAGEEYGLELQAAEMRNSFAVMGANARHQKSRAIKAEAIRLYQEKKWPSARQAAKQITPQIRAFCTAHGFAPLSSDRELQTIYGWILESSKT